MPMYTYACAVCGEAIERYVPHARNRDMSGGLCCGKKRKRAGVELFTKGKPAFQMAAVLNDGRHVPGHFGKDAARRRKG